MTSSSSPESQGDPQRQSTARAELASQLQTLPAFRALLRSVEAALIAGVDPLPEPVLDLGCGDGDFGSRTLPGKGTLGIDSDLASVGEARGAHSERIYCAGSATAVPLASGSMGTVVANSVLEHIPDLEGALSECARLLPPGGRLVLTAPCHRFTESLLGWRILQRIGSSRLADRYDRWFNTRSQHHHLLSIADWQTLLEAHGFRVTDAHYYFSPRAHAAFEVLHYLGSPTLVFRSTTGRWLPWRNPITYRVANRWLAPLASPVVVEEGSYLFLTAERRE